MIVVTAGHGGSDPGACANGFEEARFSASVRNAILYYLRSWGVECEGDGMNENNLPLAEAIALAKKGKVAVEIHLNASSKPSAFGVEALASEKDKELSQALCRAVAEVTGTDLRGDGGWKSESSGQHRRLGYVQAGGIVLELEFITNKKRMKTLYDKFWVVSKAIAEVLKNHVEK